MRSALPNKKHRDWRSSERELWTSWADRNTQRRSWSRYNHLINMHHVQVWLDLDLTGLDLKFEGSAISPLSWFWLGRCSLQNNGQELGGCLQDDLKGYQQLISCTEEVWVFPVQCPVHQHAVAYFTEQLPQCCCIRGCFTLQIWRRIFAEAEERIITSSDVSRTKWFRLWQYSVCLYVWNPQVA